MLPPLLSALVKKPRLLLDHLHNYADLFQQEMQGVASNLLRTVMWWIVLIASTALFVLFAGVALMLGVMQGQFHWVLAAVPLCMLVVALVALLMTRQPVMQGEIHEIKRQFAADLEALQQTGERNA